MNNNRSERIGRIVGLGFDNADGHVRITRGDNFDVFFGSEATHEVMQATCLKINEQLQRQGRRLEDLSRKEFIELVSRIE